jgi:hypothetical protein
MNGTVLVMITAAALAAALVLGALLLAGHRTRRATRHGWPAYDAALARRWNLDGPALAAAPAHRSAG